jgi:predicted dehydrogenase
MLALACDGEKSAAPDFAHALHVHRLLAAVDSAVDTGQRQKL